MTLEEGYSRSVHLGKKPGSQKARLSFSLTQLLYNYFSTPLMMNTTSFLRNLLKKNYLRLWRRLFPIRFWEFGDEQQFSLAPKTTKNLPWYVPVWKLHVFFPFDKTPAIWILIKKKSYYIQHEGVIIAKDLKFSNENWIKLSWHNTQTLQKLFIT